MKVMNNKILFLIISSLLSLLYTSCTNQSPNSMIDSFRDKVEYAEEKSSINTDEIRKPYLMHSYKDILIFGNIHYENFISFINYRKTISFSDILAKVTKNRCLT